MRAGRKPEALAELKQAADLAPENAHFSYVYAIAVASADRPKAIEILQRVLDAHAYDREILQAAASFELEMGNREQALGYATRLAQLEPDDPSVRNFLGQIRQ